jgi:hypothetical protein
MNPVKGIGKSRRNRYLFKLCVLRLIRRPISPAGLNAGCIN